MFRFGPPPKNLGRQGVELGNPSKKLWLPSRSLSARTEPPGPSCHPRRGLWPPPRVCVSPPEPRPSPHDTRPPPTILRQVATTHEHDMSSRKFKRIVASNSTHWTAKKLAATLFESWTYPLSTRPLHTAPVNPRSNTPGPPWGP